MHRLLPFLFLFSCLVSFGQNSLLNTAVSWFRKADRTTIDTYLKSYSYQFLGEKDSLNFRLLSYSQVKTENGTQPFIHLLLSDTALEYISVDTYGQQGLVSGLKSGGFKSIGTDINGNFITTTYDNGNFLVHEDYEAVGNPLGKGEIAYFRYRVIRKNGKLDVMNGEKTVLVSENGSSYTGIRENYRNGVLEGERTFYFPNGTVKRKENYRAGRLNGLVSDYNEEGKLIHSSTHSYHWKYGMEKWYNSDGKVVKSMQWQRDLPVGIQKQTFNGTVVESIPYVKGVKQGVAKVPVYFEESADSANTEPLGIETVNYQNNLKSGKAICTRFGSNDTLYTAFYKAGKLDSTYTWYQQSMKSYYKNVPRYTATYVNGLEHGTRIYVITAGPLKDSIYQTEPYTYGKLDGLVVQYYKKNEDQSPEFVPGEWVSNYSFETYRMGVQNGPFLFREDSVNYIKGNYTDGKLDGLYETGMLLGGKRIKTTGTYQNGLKTGEWTTDYLSEGVVVTERFENGLKHGEFNKRVNGFKTEERSYHSNILEELTFFEKNNDYDQYSIELRKGLDSIVFVHHLLRNNASSLFKYILPANHYKLTDTLLATLVSELQNNPEMSHRLNRSFIIKTTGYGLSGDYLNGKLNGILITEHYDARVIEKRLYENGASRSVAYKQVDQNAPYSGTFISATSGQQISVKDGLRHGWCVEYDSSGKEIVREKYVHGIMKKRISDESLPPPEAE